VILVIPVDGVAGFCGEGDAAWVDGHFQRPFVVYL
jgi:hypothetical protein